MGTARRSLRRSLSGKAVAALPPSLAESLWLSGGSFFELFEALPRQLSGGRASDQNQATRKAVGFPQGEAAEPRELISDSPR